MQSASLTIGELEAKYPLYCKAMKLLLRDGQQLISRSQPQRDVSLVGLMNELGQQGWELVAYAQPFTGYHGGCYTFKRQK